MPPAAHLVGNSHPPHRPAGRGARLWALLAPAGLGGLVAYLFWPTLRWLALSWRADGYYSHGPLLCAAAAWLGWRAWRRGPVAAPGEERAGDGWAIGLVAAGVAAQLAATRWGQMPLSAAALAVALLGLAGVAGGRRGLRAAAYPAALLLLAVPLPWVDKLAPPLAGRVAAAAAGLASALGQPVASRGAQLIVADGAFTVGAPCSGLRSMMAMMGLAAVLAGLLELGPARRLGLVALALPLALLANGLRLLLLLLTAQGLGSTQALALYHGPLGLGGFVALAAVLTLMALRWGERGAVAAGARGRA